MYLYVEIAGRLANIFTLYTKVQLINILAKG